ncbi:MAG: RIP metalloprotease RseP [Candidatus Binataceae bacterium]
MLTSIVAAVVILGLLIIVHEAGHFVMAKRCGVRVIRFSIGYPPKVFGFRRGETEYAVGAVPLGGYVRMLGDEIGENLSPGDIETYLREVGLDLVAAAKARGFSESFSKDGPQAEQELLAVARRFCSAESAVLSTGTGGALVPAAHSERGRAMFGRALQPVEALLLGEVDRHASVPEALKALTEAHPSALVDEVRSRAFPTQNVGKRILIVLAGPLANFVFAPIGLAIILMYGVPRLLPVLGEVKHGLPAFSAGLQTGDRILSIDGHELKTWDDLSNSVKASRGHSLRIEFERRRTGASTRQTVALTPVLDQERGLGAGAPSWIIGVLPHGDSVVARLGPISAVEGSALETGRLTGMLVTGIIQIFRGTTPIRQALGGPIMIAQMAGQEAHEGFANVGMFTVMLSLELAIINLFPVPLLDGGHLAFFLIEYLRGKPVTMRHREIAQRVGLLMLVALMAFVIFNDISRIVQG